MIDFGIIGTSWITSSFIKSAHSTNKWTLKAVYSRSTSSAQSFTEKNSPTPDQIAIHTTIPSLASDSSISTVYIASPNSLHYEHAKAMLEAGKHVILEKPSTSTSRELSSLFELAASKKLFLLEAYRHLHESNFLTLKNSLDKLGPLTGGSLSYCQYSSRYTAVLNGEPTPNIFSLDFSGGALVDLGVYVVSAAIFIFGEPEDATYWPVKISTGADGGGILVLKYKDFAVQLQASKMWNSSAPSEVYGQNGTLSIPTITDVETVTYWDAKSKEKVELGGEKRPIELNLSEEAEEFERIIREGDWGAQKRWEGVSRAVLGVTEKVRRENGLVFGVER